MSAKSTRGVIEIRKVGMKALTDALGDDDAQAFLGMFRGTGDFTKDRHKYNPTTHEEIVAGIMKIQDARAKGLVDIAGRPIVAGVENG